MWKDVQFLQKISHFWVEDQDLCPRRIEKQERNFRMCVVCFLGLEYPTQTLQ